MVESQKLANNEDSEPEDKVFCRNSIFYNDRRKVCVNFKTDTDKLNIVMYRYRNNLYFEGDEVPTITDALGKTDVIFELHCHILQAVLCTGWKNCSQLKQFPSKKFVFFLLNNFRYSPGVKLSFERKSVRKNLFLTKFRSWGHKFILSEMDRTFKFGGIIGYADTYSEFVFCHSKVFRIHAFLNDAAETVPSDTSKGLCYCYLIDRGPF